MSTMADTHESKKRKIEELCVAEEKKLKPKTRYEEINRTISNTIDMDPIERIGYYSFN